MIIFNAISGDKYSDKNRVLKQVDASGNLLISNLSEAMILKFLSLFGNFVKPDINFSNKERCF